MDRFCFPPAPCLHAEKPPAVVKAETGGGNFTRDQEVIIQTGENMDAIWIEHQHKKKFSFSE